MPIERRKRECLRLGTSNAWVQHFAKNAKSLLEIPWERGAELSEAERKAIATSVQEFQRGESSEGGYLYRCAREYADQHSDPEYVQAIRLFIREEQRHARALGQFLTLAGIPLLKRTWPDAVFRKLRHMGHLEVSICVLITAEIIAKVYYAVLREATRSTVLRRLCDQILHDELAHVEFQAERLAILRRGRSVWRLKAAHGLQRFLFSGTCLVVWWKHRKAMKSGGFGFSRFWTSCWREMRDAICRMNPYNY